MSRRITFLLTVALLVASAFGVASAHDYSGHDFIITAEELNAVLGNDNVRILDAQSRSAYLNGHIPGAIQWDVELLVTDERFNFEFADIENAVAVFSEAGISQDDLVVIYWGNRSYATYTFWVLDYLGHENVKILNGGIDGWIEEGYPVETTENTYAPTEFVPNVQPHRYASIEWVQEHLDDTSYSFIDARNQRSFESSRLPAQNAHFTPAGDFFVGNTAYLKSPEEIERIFIDAGVDLNNSLVAFCTRGLLASQVYWVLRVSGYEDVRNFEASMTGWIASGLPVASGRVQ